MEPVAPPIYHLKVKGKHSHTTTPPPILSMVSNEELPALVSAYEKVMTTWHPQLVALKRKHPSLGYGDERKPPIKHSSAQMVNFLAYHQGRGFTREQLDYVQEAVSGKLPHYRKAVDIIQSVNKCDQRGLKRTRFTEGRKTLYGLATIEWDLSRQSHRKDTTTKQHLSANEEAMRAQFRAFAEERFEKGHKDPRKPLSDSNVVMQPHSINATARDRYIFDDRGLPRNPTSNELIAHGERYYTQEEMRKIVEAWSKLLQGSAGRRDATQKG